MRWGFRSIKDGQNLSIAPNQSLYGVPHDEVIGIWVV